MKIPAAKFPVLKINLNRLLDLMDHVHGAGTLHLCLKPFGCIMVVTSLLLTLPLPRPPWTMGIGPAVTASKGAGYHHLIDNSRPWYKNTRQFPLHHIWAKHNLIWRIGILLLNLFVFLLYVNSHLSKLTDSWLHVDWSPRRRMDTTVCLSEHKLCVFLIID